MKIEDLKINYTATATNLNKNKEIVFKKGSLYEAIRASIAIPTVFTPVKKGGDFLVECLKEQGVRSIFGSGDTEYRYL